MDVEKLLSQLIRYRSGDRKVWSVVHVPSVEDEDRRHLNRELAAVKKDRTRHNNRIKGLLDGQGIRMAIKDDFLERLDAVRTWDGALLPPGLQMRLKREYERMKLAKRQIKELERDRTEAIRLSEDPSVEMVRQLLKLKGIGLPVLAFRAREQCLAVHDGILLLAQVPESQGSWRIGRTYTDTACKRVEFSRTWYEQGWEPAHTWYGC